MTVHVVRHAHAGSRSDWEGDDTLRPLSAKGRRQAAGITDRLAALGVGRIASSPYARCVETVEPLADLTGMSVEALDILAEESDPTLTIELVRSLAAVEAVLCSHGDVIPALIADLAAMGVPLFDNGRQLGSGDLLRCAKGSTWDLELEPDGRVVRGVYLPPPR